MSGCCARLSKIKNCCARFCKRYAQLLIAWVVVLVIWIINWVGLVRFYTSGSDRGTFGDMFGGVNALFTGLAFATLIYTTWMQQRELKLQRMALRLQRTELRLQRVELGNTREEIKGQKEQLQQQSATFELQRFESTIFSLLNVHRDNLNAINYGNRHGADAFYSFHDRLSGAYNDAPGLHPKVSMDPENRVTLAYNDFYKAYQNYLGAYFHHLYLLFDFINQSELSNKKLYSNIVRAQFSSLELAILFYHSISMYGRDFKPLVEEFTLFLNLPTLYLLDANHKRWLGTSAFISP